VITTAQSLLDALCVCEPEERAELMGLLADECLDRADEATARGWRWLAAEEKWPSVDDYQVSKVMYRAVWYSSTTLTYHNVLPFALESGGRYGDAAFWRFYESLQEALGAAAALAGLWLEKQNEVSPAQSSCDSEGVQA
jgi:hypothetical protein